MLESPALSRRRRRSSASLPEPLPLPLDDGSLVPSELRGVIDALQVLALRDPDAARRDPLVLTLSGLARAAEQREAARRRARQTALRQDELVDAYVGAHTCHVPVGWWSLPAHVRGAVVSIVRVLTTAPSSSNHRERKRMARAAADLVGRLIATVAFVLVVS